MRKNGFTLVETIVYIALLSIMLGGIFSASYSIIESSARQSQSIAVDEELNFIFRKIDWILSGVSGIDAPTDSSVSYILKVHKYDLSRYSLTLKDGLLMLSRGNAEAIPLNSESVKIDAVSFYYISPIPFVSSAGIDVVLKIGDRIATSTYYVR